MSFFLLFHSLSWALLVGVLIGEKIQRRRNKQWSSFRSAKIVPSLPLCKPWSISLLQRLGRFNKEWTDDIMQAAMEGEDQDRRGTPVPPHHILLIRTRVH